MDYYDSYVDSYTDSMRIDFNALTSDESQRIRSLQQKINEFKSNPERGTRKAFVQEAKKFAKNGYNKSNIEGIYEGQYGISFTIASYAGDAAFRKSIPLLEKKLKQLKQ